MVNKWKAYTLISVLFWVIAVYASAQEWREVQCLPNAPFTFCTLEKEACDAGCLVVKFSPDGRLLATVSDPPNNVIKIWAIYSGELLHIFHAQGTWMTFVAIDFSPDGQLLAATYMPAPPPNEPTPPGLFRGVKVWKVPTGQEVYSLAENVWWLAFSPDGKWLATCSYEEKTVKLWDAATGQLTHTFAADAPTFITFSPQGILLINENYARLRLLNINTGENVYTLEEPDFRGPSVFNPEGNLLATGSSDGTIKLWDVATGQKVRVLLGHSAGLMALAFSPDGRFLASSAKDHTLRFWDVEAGHEVYTLDFWSLFKLGEGYSGANLEGVRKMTRIFSIAFSPDGTLLASGTRILRPGETCPCRGMVHLWSVVELLQK